MHQTGKSSAGNQAANQVWHNQRRTGRLTFASTSALAAISAATLLAGCGANYRPVVSAINPVGPAGQPTKYAVAISSPSPTSLGLVTIVDFSGDTVLSTPSILRNPTYFTLANNGSLAYVVNADGQLDNFPVSNPTTLITSNVGQTTLVAGANPVSITPVAGTSNGTTIFIPQAGASTPATASVAALSSNGPSLLANLSTNGVPNYVVAGAGAPRAYALVNGTGAGNGVAEALETTTPQPSISASLPVGNSPVYGVMSADGQRVFVVNKGSGTLTVINVQTNALDVTTPTIPATGTLGTNPVWAVAVPTLAELVVLNAGDGATPGSLSVIDIPQCNAATPLSNPNCNTANPTDAYGFGRVVATVPVGVNPTMVDVMSDGSRAYIVNQSNIPSVCGGEGSVSVVSLGSNSVTQTICATSSAATTVDALTSPTLIYGHPNSVSVTSGSPTGKVYITSWDSKFMTVLRTDTDTVQTHISLQGVGVALPTGTRPQSPGVLVTQE